MRTILVAAWATVALVGCNAEIGGQRSGTNVELSAPPRLGFEMVADAMQTSCGTLDCHGQIGRNLRLYGGRGLRLDPLHTALQGTTTDDEYDATYWSIIGLEPEVLTQVVIDKGADPERLALVRKGRGVELHKGGTLMIPKNSLDRCLLSWLAKRIDDLACEEVFTAPRPTLAP